MSKNDYLLTGTGTLYSLIGLLILLGLYLAASGFNVYKIYRAFANTDSALLHRLQGLLIGVLATLLLRMLWILFCLLLADELVTIFLSVAPHASMNVLGSVLCYFWCEMCLNAEESRKKRWGKCNVAGVFGFNLLSITGLFLAAVDWNNRGEWQLWEDIYISNLVLSLILALGLLASGRLVFRSVREAIRTESGETAAARLKNMSQWCALGFCLKGLLPTIVFLKLIDTSRTVDHDGFQVAFIIVLSVFTELIPLLIILAQLRVTNTKPSHHPLSASEDSPSINSLEPLSRHSGDSASSVDISTSFLLS